MGPTLQAAASNIFVGAGALSGGFALWAVAAGGCFKGAGATGGGHYGGQRDHQQRMAVCISVQRLSAAAVHNNVVLYRGHAQNQRPAGALCGAQRLTSDSVRQAATGGDGLL
ncbi:hypothetical protein V8C86DRAFT_3099785 [Haematococcus lacustris]